MFQFFLSSRVATEIFAARSEAYYWTTSGSVGYHFVTPFSEAYFSYTPGCSEEGGYF